MTKAELIAELVERAEITRRQAGQVLDGLRDVAVEELRGDAKAFMLPGVAKFSVSHRGSRMGRNVRTGEAIEIPARDVVKCKISRAFQADCCD